MNKNNTQYEIERKYIIRFPDIAMLKKRHDCHKAEIIQTYLVSSESVTRRVRKTVINKEVSYIYNEKTPLSGMTRIEKEQVISESEYHTLLEEADPALSPVRKTRFTLPYGGYRYEIDIYPFSKSKAVLEIELPDESSIPPKPPFLTILKEVTGDKAFSNYAIASMVPEALTD